MMAYQIDYLTRMCILVPAKPTRVMMRNNKTNIGSRTAVALDLHFDFHVDSLYPVTAETNAESRDALYTISRRISLITDVRSRSQGMI